MRILMVSIPSHHFFQWANQLEGSGHEVYWFDISNSRNESERIKWIHQITDWKLKWDFPGRNFCKQRLPKLYKVIQRVNDRKDTEYFKDLLGKLKPDIVHSFAMQLSCIPILTIMKQYNEMKWIYSSWGSDIFLHQKLGISTELFKETLQRVNYLITDCERDYQIALNGNFTNEFLGVYIGNGGLDLKGALISDISNRNILLIKGYEDGIGKSLEIVKAIELLELNYFKEFEIIIYSTDLVLKEYVEKSHFFNQLDVKIFKRGEFISNDLLLKIMGKSILHIANSISDGLPTSAVEAMGMGAFPIQSNPGKVSEEVITHGKNGYLIRDPFDIKEIALHIEESLINLELRQSAQTYNVNFVNQKFNRAVLKKQIEKLYENIH